jgi:hypothetical protein
LKKSRTRTSTTKVKRRSKTARALQARRYRQRVVQGKKAHLVKFLKILEEWDRVDGGDWDVVYKLLDDF